MNPPSQTVAVVPEAAQRVHGTTPPHGSTMLWMWSTDSGLLEKAAGLLVTEARYYYEGHVENGPGGTLVWPKGSERAQVTHHELTRTAELLRDMAKRMIKKSNPGADGRGKDRAP